MAVTVDQLVRAANQAAAEGRWQDAQDLWFEVRRVQPDNIHALFSLGVHALQRDDRQRALELLRRARQVAPNDPLVLLTLSSAYRVRGDAENELEAITASLAADAYYLPALLAKASWLERAGLAVAAAAMYGNALKVAPPEPQWPPALRPDLEYARGIVNRNSQALRAHLAKQVAELQAQMPGALAGRWNEAVSIMAGQTQPYRSESNQLCVPRLPAIPFFDRADFPWVAAIESRTDDIRAELLAALQQERERFSPYIGYNPGDPVNQWQELNHSLRWSVYQLWRSGMPVEENLARCPQTAAALRAVEMADIGGLCPNAMFSALAPHTQIPPHHGETNARLVVHLPLIVPERCRYRVGFEHRTWTVGELLIFDDTIEHEARNDSDELRVVLIFDVWNPLLTAVERKMVTALAAAARTFGGVQG